MRNNIGLSQQERLHYGYGSTPNSTLGIEYHPAAKDFLSITDTSVGGTGADIETTSLALGPRQADGSLPNVDFMKLAAGSAMIDKGTNVGLPYVVRPRLGRYEYGATAVRQPAVLRGPPGDGKLLEPREPAELRELPDYGSCRSYGNWRSDGNRRQDRKRRSHCDRRKDWERRSHCDRRQDRERRCTGNRRHDCKRRRTGNRRNSRNWRGAVLGGAPGTGGNTGAGGVIEIGGTSGVVDTGGTSRPAAPRLAAASRPVDKSQLAECRKRWRQQPGRDRGAVITGWDFATWQRGWNHHGHHRSHRN